MFHKRDAAVPRKKHLQAMTLVRPNVWSPAESSLQLGVQRHGIPDGRCNVVVPGITFRSGAAISLDIAWVEFKVGVEYDGDHHRTDKVQWRRDNEKRERLRAHGWILIIVTAQNLIDEMSIAELALRIARRLAERGATIEFEVIAISLEELARKHGYRYDRRR